MTPQARPDIAKWSYAKWDSAQRIPVPAGWSTPVDPWAACAYSGLSKGSAASPVELSRIADDPSAEGSRAQLVTLIDEHLDASGLDGDGRAKLREFLEADFEGLQTTVLMRGDTAADSEVLTLAAAQDLHDVVAAGDQLTDRQQKHAEILLRDAPWQYGYGAAFKALVKAVPVDQLSEAYAIAVARLSRADPAASQPSPGRYEDLEVLTHLFEPSSKKTRTYLARRVRRDLATLAKQSPDAYARVASQMLIAWDEPLSRRAYAPAFVMLGAESPLEARSDYVRADIDMGFRRDPDQDI